MDGTTRRRFLQGTATGVIGVTSGCSVFSPTSDSDTTPAGDRQTDQPTTSATQTPTSTPTPTMSDAWPMFCHDPLNSGVSDTKPPTEGVVNWKFKTNSQVNSPPTVKDGTVYVGCEDGRLYAINAFTGEKQWIYQELADKDQSAIRSAPAVANGTVWFYTGLGELHAIKASDGTHITATGGLLERPKWMHPSPTVVNDTVYIGMGNGGVIRAIDVNKKKHLWIRKLDTPAVYSTPAVVDDTVFIGSDDGNVYALAADDGSILWRFDTGGPVRSGPAVKDGTVYVGSRGDGGNVFALNATDGSKQWQYLVGGLPDASPAVADGIVYMPVGNVLYALSADTGGEQWRFETGRRGESPPAVVDGTVYVAAPVSTSKGRVYAIDAAKGTKQWEFKLDSEVLYSSPAVVDGTLYIGDLSSTVYAIN